MDAQDRVLLAIYNEYQKDRPNMDTNVTFHKLQLSQEEFNIALKKLENENLINDLEALRGSGDKILRAYLDNVKLSSQGKKYVEQKLNSQGKQYIEQKLIPKDGYKELCEEIINREKELLNTVKYCRDHQMYGVPIDQVEAHANATIEMYNRILGK